MNIPAINGKSIWKFFALVYLFSIPFWILGFYTQNITQSTPIKLPLSALMAFCPLAAAWLLGLRKSMSGLKHLLVESFDVWKIKKPLWLIPTVILMPTISVISYYYLWKNHRIQGSGTFPLAEISIFFLIFFVGAIGEEVGWSGFAKRKMLVEFGVLKTGFTIGAFWAVWHLVPYIEMGRSPAWILLQCISTVLLRIIMVWLFINTDQCIFAMVLFHTMINISPYLLSNIQITYDPVILLSLLLSVVGTILVLLRSGSLPSNAKPPPTGQ